MNNKKIKELEKKIEELEEEVQIYRKMKTAFIGLKNRLEDISELWELHNNKKELANSSIINQFVDKLIEEKESKLEENK